MKKKKKVRLTTEQKIDVLSRRFWIRIDLCKEIKYRDRTMYNKILNEATELNERIEFLRDLL